MLRQTDEQVVAAITGVNESAAWPGSGIGFRFHRRCENRFLHRRTPVYMDGRVELLQYFQQQSICDNYHRYGNLGDRALLD